MHAMLATSAANFDIKLAKLISASVRVFEARLTLLPLIVVEPPLALTRPPSESDIVVPMMLFRLTLTPVAVTPVVESTAMVLSRKPAVDDHFLDEMAMAFLATPIELPPTEALTSALPLSTILSAFKVICEAFRLMFLAASSEIPSVCALIMIPPLEMRRYRPSAKALFPSLRCSSLSWSISSVSLSTS